MSRCLRFARRVFACSIPRHATLVAAALALTAGCAHFPENEPLPSYGPDYGYRLSAKSGNGADSTELLLVTTFSGGGTRAAAFAYGALEQMRDTVVEFDGRPRPLVSEIDIISAVSGGSIPAAYLGLHGTGIFDDFEERFLYRNNQGALLWRLLAPWNLVRVASPYFGRGDLLAEYLEDTLFDGATFSALLDPESPAVMINATDIVQGVRFRFSQEQFDILCSDLSDYPIARAVAASSAVPVLLSPLTLRNFSSTRCGYRPPEWIEAVLAKRDLSSRRYLEARRVTDYLEPDKQPFIHLVDGGLADNLGLRATIEATTFAGGYVGLVQKTGFVRFRRVVHLVINAQTAPDQNWGKSASPPGVVGSMIAAPGVTLNRYNFETVETFLQDRKKWIEDLKAYRCDEAYDKPWRGACDDLEAFFVEINFAQHPDPEERAYLMALPTSLVLGKTDVDRVRAAARLLLSRAPEYQRLVRSLEALD